MGRLSIRLDVARVGPEPPCRTHVSPSCPRAAPGRSPSGGRALCGGTEVHEVSTAWQSQPYKLNIVPRRACPLRIAAPPRPPPRPPRSGYGSRRRIALPGTDLDAESPFRVHGPGPEGRLSAYPKCRIPVEIRTRNGSGGANPRDGGRPAPARGRAFRDAARSAKATWPSRGSRRGATAWWRRADGSPR